MASSANRTGWGSLRPPSQADVKGRGQAKGLAAPQPPLTHLVVLDFEWTADNHQKMLPCSESASPCRTYVKRLRPSTA